MRIIGGRLKRRPIPVINKLNVRPTTDMAKEALFNILNNNFDFEDIDVLDLCSGTGSIAAEFASRGARQVIAVDIEQKCISQINNIIQKFELDNLRAIKADGLHFLEICKLQFDIIFADPPYDYKKTNELVETVISRKLIKEDGWLIVEHPESLVLNTVKGFFEKRNYGRVNFSFFKLIEE